MPELVQNIGYTIKHNKIVLAIIFIVSLCVSLYISPLYIDGDQVGYTNAYNNMRGSSISEGLFIYQSNITTIEPIHFLLTWCLTNLYLGKYMVMSFINALLALLIAKLLQKINTNNFIIFFLLLTNFYVYVLFFSAERLKFSFVFLALATLNYDKRLKFLIFLSLAVLTHLQNVILVFAVLLGYGISNFSQIFRNTKKYFILTVILLSVPIWILKDQLFSKFSVYADASNANGFIKNTWQAFLLFFFSFYLSKNKLFTTSLFFVIILASSLIGSDRITLFAYFIFLSYALRYKRGVNLINILFAFYFMIKSVIFIRNIIENGHGF